MWEASSEDRAAAHCGIVSAGTSACGIDDVEESFKTRNDEIQVSGNSEKRLDNGKRYHLW
jgi:hypothetical protein